MGRGRPPRAEEAAERRLTIRWSDKEYRLVERAAESSGNAVAAWARTVLLEAARRPSGRKERTAASNGPLTSSDPSS
jgi:uncharacterized protein (DUF1778 family)